MAELTDEQRVLARARALMANKGYGWSKALAKAAETVKKEPKQ